MLSATRAVLAPFLAAAVVLTTAGCAGLAGEEADMVIRNGKIVTLDANFPQVRALAIKNGKVAAVGFESVINRFIGPKTTILDLSGTLAIPGFIEGHAHFLSIGDAKVQLDLTTADNWDDIVEMVAKAVSQAQPGELIRGRGWHQAKWNVRPVPEVEGLPVHHSLSAVSPDNPVILTHASGHATYANAKAMAMAGITSATPNPDGGEIVHDENGEPIGMFRETAGGLLSSARANAKPTDPRRLAELAQAECVSKGITSFQDAGSSFETVDMLREMAEAGELDLRLWVMLRVGNEQLRERIADYRLIAAGDGHLTVRGIKRSIDGALGSHGAWLLEPYEDLASSSGLNTTSVDSIEETARIAIENDFQLCVHAIGDRANRETLDIFEAAFRAHPDKKDLRWRVEHAQHMHPDDIPRFAELGVIASMQGVHCTSDAPFVVPRLGERRAREGAYVWRSFIDSGAVVTNGTDAPVEDVDPIASFHSSVTRLAMDGEEFYPDQRMSRMEALRSYTTNTAYAAFEEDVKGSLSPGKLADITVLSKDILEIPADEIPTTRVLFTIVGGEVVYQDADLTGREKRVLKEE